MAVQLPAQFAKGCRVRLKHLPLFSHECGIHYIQVAGNGKITPALKTRSYEPDFFIEKADVMIIVTEASNFV